MLDQELWTNKNRHVDALQDHHVKLTWLNLRPAGTSNVTVTSVRGRDPVCRR